LKLIEPSEFVFLSKELDAKELDAKELDAKELDAKELLFSEDILFYNQIHKYILS
jgi:hypothetical protein